MTELQEGMNVATGGETINKKDVAEVLKIILGGLEEGESIEARVNESTKFSQSQLEEANKELQFYQRVIRRSLAHTLRTSISGDWVVNKDLGEKCFKWQGESTGNFIGPRAVPFGGIDFESFVEGYIAAAKADKMIGIEGEYEI